MASIFSRYSQGENRVTSSILAVIGLLSLPAFDYLLSKLTDTDTVLHRISNQPSKGGKGIPDGEISANYKILIETKMPGEKVKLGQLERHLERLSGQSAVEVLIYLSADEEEPQEIIDFNERLIWKSFAAFRELLIELSKHETITLSDIESFLIGQLVAMLENETGLLPSKDKVVVVAARIAWPAYQEHGLYICQPNRSFRPVTHMAFYADGEVKPCIAMIINRHESLRIALLPENSKLRNRVEKLAQEQLAQYDGDKSFLEDEFQVFELSSKDEPETVVLKDAIPNDCVSAATGRTVAFTQGQTYTSLDKLKVEGTSTSHLREN